MDDPARIPGNVFEALQLPTRKKNIKRSFARLKKRGVGVWEGDDGRADGPKFGILCGGDLVDGPPPPPPRRRRQAQIRDTLLEKEFVMSARFDKSWTCAAEIEAKSMPKERRSQTKTSLCSTSLSRSPPKHVMQLSFFFLLSSCPRDRDCRQYLFFSPFGAFREERKKILPVPQ